MNDINEMPPKCQYCPYWEVCKYPWVCPDREQLAWMPIYEPEPYKAESEE